MYQSKVGPLQQIMMFRARLNNPCPTANEPFPMPNRASTRNLCPSRTAQKKFLRAQNRRGFGHE
jgi:hypothetical protein